MGYAVLQTYGGKYWSEGRHLYFRREATEAWREVRLPPGFVISNPKLVTQDGHVVAIVERWNSWWPYEANYGRFLLSAIRSELRPEHAIYMLDSERGTLRYLFPGHSLMLSPDRKFAAYMGSENGFSGFHKRPGLPGQLFG
jgi:hypothetical protein